MDILANPPKGDWQKIMARPAIDNNELENTVRQIMADIKINGDTALLRYSRRFDSPEQESLVVSNEEICRAEENISQELKNAMLLALENINTFHRSQETKIEKIETSAGVTCWRENRPIERVGLYIPGGTAPLFSTVLMLGAPAKIAGCREITLCTPRSRGGIHPAILYAAKLVGATKVIAAGGAQAIAALAYGTESVPKADKIFGPGNQYVTMAKMLAAAQGIAIDMPAGPSEVMIIADDTAVPGYAAADMLAQAEHSTDSQSVLVATSKEILEKVKEQLLIQLDALPRKDLAEQSLKYARFIAFSNKEDIIEFANQYAAEHLIISMDKPLEICNKIINAGSVFIGNYTPESAGDYASGTNHTLPTNGYARAYSGVSLDSFVKKITFQQISKQGLQLLGPAIETMAEAEMLHAHKNAVSLRLAGIKLETK
jgi:histidinol dehydrogenase